MAAAHRAVAFLCALETFLVQRRTCAIIACAYAAIMRIAVIELNAPPRAPAWPIYNGAQLLDATIIEPLDRPTVLGKAATVPGSSGRMRNVRVRRVARMAVTAAQTPSQAQRPLMRGSAAARESKQAGPSSPLPADEKDACSGGGAIQPSMEAPRRMVMARREVAPIPAVEDEVDYETRGSKVDDTVLLISIGAVAVAYLAVRVAWTRNWNKCGNTAEPIQGETFHL